MSEVEVEVIRNGRALERIRRPLRTLPDGTPAVTYRKQLRPVREGRIYIDAAPGPRSAANAPAAGGDPQMEVIESPVSARILVDAPPGTGKTWLACRRVAHAVRRGGLTPNSVLLVSFTRTAVAEIRNRIAHEMADVPDAAAVRIGTLDSMTWAFHSGFDPTARLSGRHEDTIEAFTQSLATDPDLRDEIRRIRHLIVDEAQDIVGPRARLMLALLDTLHQTCGVTILADRAQAIYEFAEEGVAGVRLLEEVQRRNFRLVTLERIHRTSNPRLLRIFRDIRPEVIDPQAAGPGHPATIAARIRELADGSAGRLRDLKLKDLGSDDLVLARRRADIHFASSCNAEVRHRLRMSGLPPALQPWLAVIFHDWTRPRMRRSDFEERWSRIPQGWTGIVDVETGWRMIAEAASGGGDLIDVRALRSVLGRPTPPIQFCFPEFGAEGPVLGTIHASKGREAPRVHLFLPQQRNGPVGGDPAEEARVCFVGATRARERLLVGEATSTVWSSAGEGRLWRCRRNGGVQVEIGRPGDLAADGLVGTGCFATAEEARLAQEALAGMWWETGLAARAEQALDWRSAVTVDGRRLLVLSAGLNQDLWEIARSCQRHKPPQLLPHLRIMGLRTIVLREGDGQLGGLHEPWASTGFILAPQLVALSGCNF